MPNTNTDEYLSLAEAAKIAPGRPHLSTLWRWCLKGTNTPAGRFKLRYIRAGRQIYTTRRWLDEYFSTLADADATERSPDRPDDAPSRSAKRREREIADAERRLAKAGV